MRNEDEVLVQLATRVPRDLHREIKLHCVGTGISVMEFVEAALAAALQRGRKRPTKSLARSRKR
jgi:predicted HicB family RNase H-like nuclease